MKPVIKIIVLCLGLTIIPGVCAGAKSGTKKRIDSKVAAATQSGSKSSKARSKRPIAIQNKPAPVDFLLGYKHYRKRKYLAACRNLFHVMQKHTPDDTDYEWAEFFFGLSLKRLGYSHAAIDVLGNLVTRKPNQKIVTYCLELFEQALQAHPVERETIISRVLCDQEYGFVDGLVSDFVNYHQGVYDWEHGFFEWGNQHFEKITPDTHYYYQYLYKKALLAIYREQIDEAVAILKSILNSDRPYSELKNDTRKTLARMLYEKQQFEEADFMYGQIDENILDQAENLLERSWAHYRMGQLEKAMGLLYSFAAPSYRDAFKPEYFILKSFIYKDVCHYEKAMTVIGEFRGRYDDALKIIYDRGDAADNHALMNYLLNKTGIGRTWEFLELLERERAAAARLRDKKLRAYLIELYDLQIAQSRRKLKLQVEHEYEKAANNLLRYEENAHLMEYEVGLDMYKRIYEFHYTEASNNDPKKATRAQVVYPFQGEFWNDELATYQVRLPNKCENMEEWDIFFK